MIAKDLLSQLSAMEHSLRDFSFEELATDEAAVLKKTFEMFKRNLENKIFQPSASISIKNSNDLFEEPELPQEHHSEATDSNMLIAKVSHEIRTPLNGIIGFTDLLREDNDLNDKQLEQVVAIQKASYSLMEIINELLEYSKLSVGAEVFESVDFNFRNVVGDVVYLCNTLLADKNVNLNVTIGNNVPEVLLGDPSKLTQVLLNLIGNAIKFIDKGNIDLEIQAIMQERRTLLTFTIADGGIGISEENLKHIFDSFKQAETNTYMTYGGTGLGLSIVKQIIEQLGGKIGVTSELGVGTTFEFSIPFEIGNTDCLAKKERAQSQISVQDKEIVRGMRILVFEDNVLNQRLIEQRLKAWECKTYITDNAQYGLNILANHKIDLVLMDLKMPGMSGFEITELIRSFENPNTQPIPVVALSADFSVQDREKCDACGINDFIMKPYSSEELFQKLVDNKKPINQASIMAFNPIRPDTIENKLDKIDLSEILEDCLGQVELLQELMALFKQNALAFIGNMLIHLQNSDSEQIGFAAHKIKAGLKMLQSKGLLDIIEQIEKCCHSDQDMKQLQTLYDRFLEEYPKAEKAIDTAMAELLKSKG